MNIYFRYLIKRTLSISFFIFLIFIFIDFLFNLISELEDISSSYNFIEALKFSFLSAPERAFVFLEGSCLLGFMISMGLSQEEGNLNVLRSSGISPFKIVVLSSLGSLILSIFFLTSHELALKDLSNKSSTSKALLIPNTSIKDNEFTWLKDENSYLNFGTKINNRIFDIRYFEVKNNKVIYSLVAKSAVIKDKNITFDKSVNVLINNENSSTKIEKINKNFDLPLIVSSSLRNIEKMNMRDKFTLMSYLSGEVDGKDKIYKSHLEKHYYQFILKPISILSLIIFFGYFIFGSLRESSSGSKIVLSVVGAFIFQIFQDLSTSIAISFNQNVLIGMLIPSYALFIISIFMYRKLA